MRDNIHHNTIEAHYNIVYPSYGTSSIAHILLAMSHLLKEQRNRYCNLLQYCSLPNKLYSHALPQDCFAQGDSIRHACVHSKLYSLGPHYLHLLQLCTHLGQCLDLLGMSHINVFVILCQRLV